MIRLIDYALQQHSNQVPVQAEMVTSPAVGEGILDNYVMNLRSNRVNSCFAQEMQQLKLALEKQKTCMVAEHQKEKEALVALRDASRQAAVHAETQAPPTTNRQLAFTN